MSQGTAPVLTRRCTAANLTRRPSSATQPSTPGGWTEGLIQREEMVGAVETVVGMARARARGRVEYTLRVRVNPARPLATNQEQ
jgi:23S rRNA C2498 (ribose-2'-O)-methylase RlmM